MMPAAWVLFAYLDGQSRHDVMHMALGAMTRMAHRGGGDGKNGDGAGIPSLPRGFFLRQWPALSVCAAPLGRGPALPPGCGPAGVVPATLPVTPSRPAACAWRTSATSLFVKRCWPRRPPDHARFLQLLVLPDTSSPEAAELHDPKPLNAACSLPGTWPRT